MSILQWGVSSTMPPAISELRRLRALRRRRNPLIRKARKEGHSPEEIAGAVGLTIRQVQRILR